MEKLSFTLQLSVLVMGLTLTVIPGCKTATAPQAAECVAGSLPCEDNITECCEVNCPELHHHCGDFLTECCLDTTSHDFTWTIDTLGIYGSYLKDVAIIDENNIWAVGMIKTDSDDYNAAHWDGESWELVLIDRNVDFDGVFAFSENEIWFSDGCFIYRYDGTLFNKLWECDWQSFGPGQANAIWGSSPSDIWFVGDSGSIVHHDGSGFTRMESGTDVDIRSIIGSGDHIWVSGYKDFMGAVVLEYRNDAFEIIYFRSENFWEYDPNSLSGKTMAVWTSSADSVNVLTPFGIYRVPENSAGESRLLPNYWQGFPWSIGGNSHNDIFTGGDFSSIYHYNGSSFHYYPEFSGRISTQSIEMKDETVYLVGEDYETGRGIIIRGQKP